MYNLFVHVTFTTIVCNWGKPLCGWKHEKFKAGRFYHPQTKIYIARSTGKEFDYHAISHTIQIALQDEGLAISQLTDSMGGRKGKRTKTSEKQLPLF